MILSEIEIDVAGIKNVDVVTRFTVGRGTHFNIGHAKFALLNDYIAHRYRGQLILRWDDLELAPSQQDPLQEDCMADLVQLPIRIDRITYVSDYFEQLEELCRRLIQEGLAYADNTPLRRMYQEREEGIPSPSRTLAKEESLRIFQGMQEGANWAKEYYIRSIVDISTTNGTLRDPILYRCNSSPHQRTGRHVSPSNGFASPTIDSLEGVTHVIRLSSEEFGEGQLYEWLLSTLGMKQPTIFYLPSLWYPRIPLSERQLSRFVKEGVVTGWDDPRLPTIRGLLRRGLTMLALREYILMQGLSRATRTNWAVLWTYNQRYIDPIAARHTVLVGNSFVKVRLTGEGVPPEPTTRPLPKHKKNSTLGLKTCSFSQLILLEYADASSLKVGEEITLKDWGGAIIEHIQHDQKDIVSIEARLTLSSLDQPNAGRKKLAWLSPQPQPLVPLVLHIYDYLLADGNLKSINPVTEFTAVALGEAALGLLKKGDIVKSRRGRGEYYICDAALTATGTATTGPAATGPAATGPATTAPAATGAAATGPAVTGPAASGLAATTLGGGSVDGKVHLIAIPYELSG